VKQYIENTTLPESETYMGSGAWVDMPDYMIERIIEEARPEYWSAWHEYVKEFQ